MTGPIAHPMSRITAENTDARPVRTAVLHFGLGAFHRAHQAFYFNRLLHQENRDWGIASVNLRSHGIVDTMAAQECQYHRWQRGREIDSISVIRSITGTYHLPSQRAQVMALFESAGLQIITLTVSEKGYHYDPTVQGLAIDHADIQADLKAPHLATTLPGILVQGLEARRKAKGGPISLISCDNYRENGRILRAVVSGYARQIAPDLLPWLEQNTKFLSTMVDGIVPRVRDQDRAALAEKIGASDQAMVVAEDYMRWVIEDDFAGERPPLESVGAELLCDVARYETMKLLLLNAPHSAAAYLGHNAGLTYIDEAVSEIEINRFLGRLLHQELLPVASRGDGKAEDYGALTLGRFANPNIRYPTLQVSADGSLKMQERLFPALQWHLEQGRVPEGIALVLAAWMRFLTGQTDQEKRYSVPDPQADAFALCLAKADSDYGFVDQVLGLNAVFPNAIASNDRLRDRIKYHFAGLADHGTIGWLSRFHDSDGRRQP
ncbi:MAG: mannitol dehydrogenase family protein [Pseudomonadota bacterium]